MLSIAGHIVKCSESTNVLSAAVLSTAGHVHYGCRFSIHYEHLINVQRSLVIVSWLKS